MGRWNFTQFTDHDRVQAACSCCAGGCDLNAVHVSVRAARAGSLVMLVLAALLPRRLVPLAVLAALVAVARADIVLVAERSAGADADAVMRVTAAPRTRYVPAARPVWATLAKREALADTSSVLVKSFRGRATVTNNYARTVVSSEHENESDEAQLVRFSLNVPESAFVSALEIVVGGVRYRGVVVRKEVAEKMFAKAVDAGQTAGLLQARNSKEFAVSMNTAAGASALFEVVFEEHLTRRLGKFHYRFNMNPGAVVPDMGNAVLFIPLYVQPALAYRFTIRRS